MTSRYNENLKNYNIDSYLDKQGKINSSCIVQYESLFRVDVPQSNELLVLDEIESIFEQMFSMNNNANANMNKNFHNFLQLVMYSKRVICMDANLSTESMNII